MTNRKSMAASLLTDASTPTKTFVVEAHDEDPVGHLHDLVGTTRLEETDDAYLFRVHLDEGTFWVDQLEPRFWSWHTDMPQAVAYPFLRDHVERRRKLDWMWLPSGHLEAAGPRTSTTRVRTSFDATKLLGEDESARGLKVSFAGRDAETLLALIRRDDRFAGAISFDSMETALADEDLGTVREALTRGGRFMVVGDSFELHVAFVREVMTRYAAFVTACETRALRWDGFADGGGRLTGGPVALQFSREVPDLDRFAAELLSARLPFRLWGVPSVDHGLLQVEAVDLHVGERLRLAVGRRWMRIHLTQGGCGNTVARLVSNLQHRFDGALRMIDPHLDSLMSPQRETAFPKERSMVGS